MIARLLPYRFWFPRTTVAGTSAVEKFQPSKLAFFAVTTAILAGLSAFGFPSSAQATTGINNTINFQGKVTNADGTNVTDGTYDFVFKLYNGASSSSTNTYTESWTSAALWSSTMTSAPAGGGESLTYSSNTNESTIQPGQLLWNTTKKESVKVVAVNTSTNVITISPTKQAWTTSDTITNKIYVQSGIFSVALNSLNQDAAWGTTDFNTDQVYLGVNFNSDGEMKPRIQFTAVPYAKNAQKVNGLTVTNTSGNPTANGTTLKIADSKTVTFNNGLAFSGADSKTINFGSNNLTFSTSADATLTLPTSGTLATLAGSENLTNKTVNGLSITNNGSNTLTIAAGKTLTVSNSLTFAGTDGNTITFPSGGGTVCYTGGTCAASSVRLDQIAAATTTATIANGSNAIAWNWSSLTTQTGMTLGGGTAMTTGSVLSLGGATFVHTVANDTGSLAKITFSDNSTNANNGGVTNGLNIAATINTSGAGTKTVNGINVAAPTLTACATGGCTVNGAQINTATAGAASTITQNGLSIIATGVASGTLNGISIGGITAAGGTEVAMAIGAGWDNALTVGGTAILNSTGVLQSAGLSGTYSNALTLSSTSNSFAGATFNGLAITNNGTNTLAIAAGKTLTASNTLTLAGTDGKTMTVNNSLTLAGADAKTINFGANSITFTTSGATSLTLPTSGTLSTLAGSEALTNKSLNGLTVTTAVATSANFTKSGDGVGGLMYSGSADTWSYLARGNNGDCLKSTSATIQWTSCGGSGLFTQATGFAYLTSTTDGVVLGGSTTAGGDFWFDTTNAQLYLGVDALKNGGLTFRSSGSSITDASITTNSTGDLILSAPSGNVSLGSGSGNIALSLTNASDVFQASKTLTLAGAYSSNDFSFTRNLTNGSNTEGGSVLFITDTSNGSSTINPDMLTIDAHPSSGTFTGNLLRMELGGTDKFVINSAGNVTTGGTYNGLTISTSSGTLTIASSKTLTVNNTLTFAGTDGNTITFPSGGGTVCITSGTCVASALRLDQITAATATATIANANNAIAWNWGTLTTQTGMTMGGGTAMTTGSVLSLGGATFVHTAANDTGSLAKISFTDNSTNANNGGTTNGLNIAATIGTTGAGTKAINGINIAAPTINSCTTGACTYSGLKVTGGSIANVTSYALYADAGSGAGTEYAAAFMNGNVGVGTAAPTDTLDVNGLIRVRNPQGETAAPTRANNGEFAFANVSATQRLYFQANGTASYINASGAGDYSEFFLKTYPQETLVSGMVIGTEQGNVTRTTRHQTALGVASAYGTRNFDDNADGLRGDDPRYVNVGLLGQLPVIVSTEQGTIAAGDQLGTNSLYQGVAAHFTTDDSAVVGMAQQAFDPNTSQCQAASSVESIAWPKLANNQLPDNSQCFRLPNNVIVGKVMAYIHPASTGLTSPTPTISSDSQLALQQLSAGANGLTVATNLTVNGDLAANGNLTVSKGLTVGGTAEFQGPAVFKALADFFDNVVFHKDATFQQNVNFAKAPTFNKDTAGSAIIRLGMQSVHVTFDQPFATTPVISTTLNSGLLRTDSYQSYLNANICTLAEGPSGCETKLKAKLLSTDVHFVVSDQDATGFTVELDKPADQDLKFNWTAIQVQDPVEAVSTPTPTPTP